MELTATGIVTDSHRIPYYPSLDDSNRDPFALQRYEKKYMMFGFGDIFFDYEPENGVTQCSGRVFVGGGLILLISG